MIVAATSEALISTFESLLQDTSDESNVAAQKDPSFYQALAGKKLEDVVFEIMKSKAQGTPFDGKIVLVSGQRFPDIVAKDYFGVEVKTSNKNWKSIGNSILESTRTDKVEKIYMFFGKLSKPIEFRWRKYEECLVEIKVTHSPRYCIDMEAKPGQTIFDQIGTSYDKLRNSDKPIKPFVDYYRKHAKPGEDVWWLDGGDSSEKPYSPTIKLWNNLSESEQNAFIAKGMAYFPELFGRDQSKFNRFGVWLIRDYGVVHPNVRDSFTAGGKVTYKIDGKRVRLPRIFHNLYLIMEEVVKVIDSTSVKNLKYYWKTDLIGDRKAGIWIGLVRKELERGVSAGVKPFDLRMWMRSKIGCHAGI